MPATTKAQPERKLGGASTLTPMNGLDAADRDEGTSVITKDQELYCVAKHAPAKSW